MKVIYKRNMQFYETDGMGIIHHGNYILFMEEARTHWLKGLPIYNGGGFLETINFPVLHCEVQYKKPLYFDDEVTIELHASCAKGRLFFDYTISTKQFDKPNAFGKTVHAVMEMKSRRVIRPPKDLVDLFS